MNKAATFFSQLVQALFPKRKKFDMAWQNRIDFKRELSRCFSVNDLIRMRELLRYIVSDFTTDEFIQVLNEIGERLQWCKYIENHIEPQGYKSAVAICRIFDDADQITLHAYWLYIKKHASRYSRADHHLMGKRYLARKQFVDMYLNDFNAR